MNCELSSLLKQNNINLVIELINKNEIKPMNYYFLNYSIKNNNKILFNYAINNYDFFVSNKFFSEEIPSIIRFKKFLKYIIEKIIKFNSLKLVYEIINNFNIFSLTFEIIMIKKINNKHKLFYNTLLSILIEYINNNINVNFNINSIFNILPNNSAYVYNFQIIDNKLELLTYYIFNSINFNDYETLNTITNNLIINDNTKSIINQNIKNIINFNLVKKIYRYNRILNILLTKYNNIFNRAKLLIFLGNYYGNNDNKIIILNKLFKYTESYINIFKIIFNNYRLINYFIKNENVKKEFYNSETIITYCFIKNNENMINLLINNKIITQLDIDHINYIIKFSIDTIINILNNIKLNNNINKDFINFLKNNNLMSYIYHLTELNIPDNINYNYYRFKNCYNKICNNNYVNYQNLFKKELEEAYKIKNYLKN